MSTNTNTEKKESVRTTRTKNATASRKIDPNMLVSVKNGFAGKLIYISSRTGEEYVWEKYGDEHDMELRELKNAKGSAKKFYENNWFMFDEDWVIDYIGVREFYKVFASTEDIDNVFSLGADEIKVKLANISEGQRSALARRAKELFAEGGIDSIRVIEALEETLGITLIGK